MSKSFTSKSVRGVVNLYHIVINEKDEYFAMAVNTDHVRQMLAQRDLSIGKLEIQLKEENVCHGERPYVHFFTKEEWQKFTCS